MQYFIITLLMFIVLLVGGILGYVFRGQAKSVVKNTLVARMREYDVGSPTSSVTRAWDETQVALKCCGIDKQDDWKQFNSGYQTSGPEVRYWGLGVLLGA